MTQLSELTQQTSSRQRSNLERMARLTARLDEPLAYELSPIREQARGRHSTLLQTPTSSDDDAALRELVPRRTNGNGGQYGASILGRVAANYGIER